jgi:hypothetical protein
MFDDIAWSTERVAEQTLARAREIGLPVHILPVWYDVDDLAALRRLEAELRGHSPTSRGLHAPHHAGHTAKLIGRFARGRALDPAAARFARRRSARLTPTLIGFSRGN